MTIEIEFDPDRPIRKVSDDRLGFGHIAEKLSASVLSGSTRDGFVIGIEGRWGSGKSSILSLLCQHVEMSSSNASVIRFAPWVVGDRDSMVTSLMVDLAREVNDVELSAGGKLTTSDLSDLSKRIRQYGAQAGRGLSRIAKLAGTIGLAPGGDLASVLEQMSSIVDVTDGSRPLSEVKNTLIADLKKLDHRFVVVIDDIDRLEPSEATEIIRLIRAVGDFPNLIYVLCYDKPVLAHSLEEALRIKDGSEFLRKIVQVSFRVPLPEPFDLRRWLQEELLKLYSLSTGANATDEQTAELAGMCDAHGGQLETPRDIILVLNALRLLYPPIMKDINFVDMCWLQIIRLKQEKLYEWIEEYMGTFAALQNGASIGKSEQERTGQRLLELLPEKEDVISSRSLWRLAEYIPGIEPLGKKSAGDSVFAHVSDSDIGVFEARKRLGSPQHYRWYFSFSRPAGSMDDRIFAAIIGKAGEGKDISPDLDALVQAARPQGGTMYEVFLDRAVRNAELMEKSALESMTVAIADIADEAKRKEPERGPFSSPVVWRQSRQILAATLARMGDRERLIFLKKIFGSGKSLGWLMGEVIRHQSFSHGRVGDQSNPSRTFLKGNELDDAIAIMGRRLSSDERARIVEVPELLSFLYGWMQAGFEDDVQAWVSSEEKTDAGFLRLLNNLRGWTASDKIYHPLNKRDLKRFMDYDLAIGRLEKLAAKPKHKAIAKELLEAARIGKGDR